jgi:hypothetical protein
MGRRRRARIGTEAPTIHVFEGDDYVAYGEYCLNPKEKDPDLREYEEEEIGRLTKEQLTNNGEWIRKDQYTGHIHTDPRYYEQIEEFRARTTHEWHEKHDPKYRKGKK